MSGFGLMGFNGENNASRKGARRARNAIKMQSRAEAQRRRERRREFLEFSVEYGVFGERFTASRFIGWKLAKNKEIKIASRKGAKLAKCIIKAAIR